MKKSVETYEQMEKRLNRNAWIVSKVRRKVFYQIYKAESSGFYLR